MNTFKKIFIFVIFILLITSCSPEPEEILIDKITPTDTIYSFESLSAIGFKKYREYKNVYGYKS